MAARPTNTIWVAAGVGVGVLLFDLLLGDPIGQAVLRAIGAVVITAVLITLFERGARRS